MKTSKNVKKVDVSNNFCNGECKLFLKLKEGCEVYCAKILLLNLIYEEVSIYLKYCKPQSPLKIVKLWKKVDILKDLFYGERDFFFEMEKADKVSCVKILIFC